jgi:hypothetical protein
MTWQDIKLLASVDGARCLETTGADARQDNAAAPVRG